MCRNSFKKIRLIIILIAVIFFLFSNFKVIAVTDDDGPDVKDSSIDWQLTCYGGEALGGTGFTENDFTTNEKYGWCEYEKDGVKYVVLAAATHELLQSGEVGATRDSKLHYFSYYDTIQFEFVDKNFDNNTYNGIILDSCGASMNPTGYGHADNVQILDVYFKASTYNEKVSGQSVKITMDGTFSQDAGTTNSQSKKDMIAEFFAGIFHGIGDGIQMALNYAGTNMKWKDAKKLTYTKADIEANKKLNKKIQVEDASSEDDDDKNKKDYKTIKEVNIASTADNRKGQKETIYSSATEIPVMPIDFYSSTIDKVSLFDINFYNTKSSNSNKLWKGIRQFISSASHIAMYIAAALLLSMLIWRSILFVRSALGDNPQGAFESRRIMDNFIKSVLIIRNSIFCDDNIDVFL